MVRNREAGRAIYLASPFRFRTTLHAFARTSPPTFYIDDWAKDPRAYHRHAWRTKKRKAKGRWYYKDGPLNGVRLDGWPDPKLLSSAALPSWATKAQKDNLQAPEFWQQLSERTLDLRDVLSVADLAVIIDALLTADHRHTHLMEVLAREFIDDVSKMTFVEAAVIVNAYANFNCSSNALLRAMASHVTAMLSGEETGNPYLQGATDLHADPRSLAVVVKGFAALDYRSSGFLTAINAEVLLAIDRLTLADLADIFSGFVSLRHPFQSSEAFWASSKDKVPGSRMQSLVRCLASLAPLEVSNVDFREELVQEILKAVQAIGAPNEFESLAPLGSEFVTEQEQVTVRLPPFSRPQSRGPPLLMVGRRYTQKNGVAESFPASPPVLTGANQDTDDVFVDDDMSTSLMPPVQQARRRWYNPIGRRPLGAMGHAFVHYGFEETYGRNRRGALIAEALHGLHALWQQAPAGEGAEIPVSEKELAEAAWPVLKASIQGVPSKHLRSCAQLYGDSKLQTSSAVGQSAVCAIAQESVRKLSNFSPEDVKRVREATEHCGMYPEAYLQRAMVRRFALRERGRTQGGAALP